MLTFSICQLIFLFIFAKFRNCLNYFFHLEWLRQMCIHSCFHTSSGILFKCIRRHCNDRNIFCILPVHCTDPFRCGDSIHVWHHNIHQDRIKSSWFTSGKCTDRLLSILHQSNVGAYILQSPHSAHCLLQAED